MRFARLVAGSALALGMIFNAAAARADATALPSPAAPLPVTSGPGLDSTWAEGDDPSIFLSLDTALRQLTVPGTASVDSLGPVSVSNFLLPIGDFPYHLAMPFSASGTPVGLGQYIVGRMVGYWAARAPGTYTFVIGSDDGSRLILQGAEILNEPAPQEFSRAAAVVEVSQAGLYTIELDYFNGVQEGALELSIAEGDVPLASPVEPVPSSFALVPQSDLYPLTSPDAGAGEDGGDTSSTTPDGGATMSAPEPGADAGALSADGSSGTGASMDASSGSSPLGDGSLGPFDASASYTDGGVGYSLEEDGGPAAADWYGGGCTAAPTSPRFALAPSLASFVALFALTRLRRRWRSAIRPSSARRSS